jgi:hypothetical protein
MIKVFLILWMHVAGGEFTQPQKIEMPTEAMCQAVLAAKMAEAAKHYDEENETTVSYMGGCLVERAGGRPA